MNIKEKREFSLIFLAQFFFVIFVVFYNTCSLNLSSNFINNNSNLITTIIYSLFFMCAGYANFLTLEKANNPQLTILIRGIVFYAICLLLNADMNFIFAITYVIICGFCMFSNINILLAAMAFTFGIAGIISNTLSIFGFLLVYIGMLFAKSRKTIHYIPMGNFIIPIFTIVLLDNLFRYYVVYNPNAVISISTIGITIVLFLIITCVPVYSQGRKITIMNISSVFSFFLYQYETKLLEAYISPVLNAFVVLFVNTLIAWGVFVVVSRCMEKYNLKVLSLVHPKTEE